MAKTDRDHQHGLGNSYILTRVDKIRELVGTKVALPQVVVVGDQSSGKSSVLEGLTEFAFPRDAGLCTRYVTQITCRREAEESIEVSIIPHENSTLEEQDRLREFKRTLNDLSPETLTAVFTEASREMRIRESSKPLTHDELKLPAFSQHMLKIEKLGPNEEHFTVIDVPGIFRRETEGMTTESDIELVKNMVTHYMKYPRTIILAIIPSNVDPATQDILTLAKKADPEQKRTMAVLTKADLAIEPTTQRIVIDHVLGNRNRLPLGYYVVKNRGPDQSNWTLQEGQAKEREFFSEKPWLALASSGKAGTDSLKRRVRDLLVDLIKKEFPALKKDVAKELSDIRSRVDKMGPSRSEPHAQRTYLNKISETFQSFARDALNAYYAGHHVFTDRKDLRLITRIVEENERYSKTMACQGHTRQFKNKLDDQYQMSFDGDGFTNDIGPSDSSESESATEDQPDESSRVQHADLDGIFSTDDPISYVPKQVPAYGIMQYIQDVYNSSRGLDLGTFSGSLIATLFKEQSKAWIPITLTHMKKIIDLIHHFMYEIMKEICPDTRVRDELWNGFLLDEYRASYVKAIGHAKLLLEIEQDGDPMTLNHYFNDTLQKARSDRLLTAIKKSGTTTNNGRDGERISVSLSALQNLCVNESNSEHMQAYIHDILKSYYKVARKRFVDVICQQAIAYHLLQGKHSPLKVFCTDMVMKLSDEQLDMIAGEDTIIKEQREKLARDVENFEEALKVLRGSA
ncbi:P-loop containing nucleoside triphosphate hydrolase protein [Xylariomycetidae sp. FL2044]|nr:P-loop containing nucleoside triphosphate hydrolase protein [Xylariomycetidae sp. FL2044]